MTPSFVNLRAAASNSDAAFSHSGVHRNSVVPALRVTIRFVIQAFNV